MYGYVGNDPVNYIDPSGLLSWPSDHLSGQNCDIFKEALTVS